MKHWAKQVTSPVLFSDVSVKVLNVDECKLDSNINNSSKVDGVVEIGLSAILSRIAKNWWESSITDRDPLCGTSLENPENNLEYIISSIDNTINSIQRTILRETFTASNLSCYPVNSLHLLLQKDLVVWNIVYYSMRVF